MHNASAAKGKNFEIIVWHAWPGVKEETAAKKVVVTAVFSQTKNPPLARRVFVVVDISAASQTSFSLSDMLREELTIPC